MAAGLIFPSPEFVKSGAAVMATQQPAAPWPTVDVPLPMVGAETDTQPITEPQLPKAGSLQPMFGFADWYDRIHITPGAVDLGNVVSQQTQNVVVWNAYTTPKTLASITATEAEGITLTEPASAPLVFEGLRERTYVATVSTDGPATIGARFAFDFIAANDVALSIKGTRIIAWTWAADWSDTIVERLDWNTDVITAYDGAEQRIKLRQWPLRAIEFAFSAEGRQRRRLENALYGWGARVWALPVWTDGQRLAANVAAGALSIPVPTSHRDFHAGGLVMLLADDGRHEVVEIATVGASALDLARPVIGAWPAGSCAVYPVRLARLPDSHGLRRFTGEFAFGRVRMDLQDISEWPTATETAYRGQPVLLDAPDWSGEPDVDFTRKLAALDFGTGLRVFDDESDKPEIVQAHRWFLDTRAKIAAFRSWLYARAGKFAAVWVPTWVRDLTMTSNLGAGGTSFTVENVGYTRQVGARVHRRDVRIELMTGQVFYRRITGSAEVNDDTETISIDTALGVAVTPADVARISFMSLCRLDGDGVELAWFTGDAAQAATNMRATGNDA